MTECQPKDRIEGAVCDGDYSAFASPLNKMKHFWRSKLRKRVRPERVTALHFAALFGENRYGAAPPRLKF